MKKIKRNIILIICLLTIAFGSFWFSSKLNGIDRLIFGLWGLAILIGTTISERVPNKKGEKK